MRAAAAVCAIALSGCASVSPTSTTTAVLADGVTTAVGLASGHREGNPLLQKDGAVWASVVLRAVMVARASDLPEPERTEHLAAVQSVTSVAVVNNVAAVLGASQPVALAAGLVSAVWLWLASAEQRAFARACAQALRDNPRLQCHWRGP